MMHWKISITFQSFIPLNMSFYDCTPIASMLDELTLEDIVVLLGEQEVSGLLTDHENQC